MFIFWQSSDTVISDQQPAGGLKPGYKPGRKRVAEFFTGNDRSNASSCSGIILLLFFKYLILIIGSPLFAYLSEKTEAIIEGKEYTWNWASIKKDCIRVSSWIFVIVAGNHTCSP